MFLMGAGMVASGATLGQTGGYSGITGSLATAGGIGSGMMTPHDGMDIQDIQTTDNDFNQSHGGGTDFFYWQDGANPFDCEMPPEIQKFRAGLGEDFVLDGNRGSGFGFSMMA